MSKRVLFLTRRVYPQIGGVESHVLGLSRELVKHGYKINILAEALEPGILNNSQNRYIGDNMAGKFDYIDKSTKSKILAEQLSTSRNFNKDSIFSENIIITRLPYVKAGRLKKFIIWFWLIKNINFIQTADLIHCHDVFFWYLPFRILFFRKPVYTTFHGYESYPVASKAKLIRKLSEKMSWGNICIGEFIQKWYGTKANLISYGAAKPVSNSYSLKIKNKNQKLKILFIGRIEKDTGIPIYLTFLKLLQANNVKFEFEVCGDGSLSNKIVRYGKVHGFIENINGYIKEADIVFTSSYLSILESLVYKKTIIAVYDNPLKKDYLYMTPFSKWIHIMNDNLDMLTKYAHLINKPTFYDKVNSKAVNWVYKQTYNNLALTYIKLWSN